MAFDTTEAELLAPLLEGWAKQYGASSVRIVSPPADAEQMHAVKARMSSRLDVELAGDGGELAQAEMIVAYGETAKHGSWQEELMALGRNASRLLVVVVPNPRFAIDWIERRAIPAMSHTEAIAPVLWEIGRVRDHVFFGAPTPIMEAAALNIKRRVARSHAFVVDTAPRTPQARRKLHTVS